MILGRMLFDTAIVHPAAQSHARRSVAALATAKYEEKKKCDKYAELARREGAKFRPVVLETLGAWGEQAREFLKELSKDAGLTQTAPPGGFVRYGRQLISLTLQRGNAHVMHVGCGARRSGRRSRLSLGPVSCLGAARLALDSAGHFARL